MFAVEDTNALEKKYAGTSKALVIDNRDPLQRGRIIVDHPLLGETVWIQYLRTPGSFNSPSIGDVVYVECDSGIYTHPIAWGNIVKGPDASPEIPEVFKRDIPTNRGFFTPNGHLIEFDDGVATLTNDPNDTNFTTASRGIRMTTTAGNKIHIAEDSDASNEFILLEDVGGNLLKLDYNVNDVSLNSVGTSTFTTAQDHTHTIGANTQIDTAQNYTHTVGEISKFVTGTEHQVEAPIVRLGQEATSFHAVLAENLVSYNDMHTHPAPQAPAGVLDTLPPVVKMADLAGTAMDVTALKIFLAGND